MAEKRTCSLFQLTDSIMNGCACPQTLIGKKSHCDENRSLARRGQAGRSLAGIDNGYWYWYHTFRFIIPDPGR